MMFSQCLLRIFLLLFVIFPIQAFCCDDGWINPASDSVGVKQACREFKGESTRFRITRDNTDPFNTEYTITREYCWAYNIFTGNCFDWGDTKVLGYTSNNIPYEDYPGVYGKLKLYKKVVNGREQVCGSITFSIIGTGGEFGCVDVPLRPGPPVYNKVISTGNQPIVYDVSLQDKVVDGNITPGYISLGSTFDKPIIKLIIPGGLKSGENAELTLKYRFPGDPDTSFSTCGKFLSTSNGNTYCAVVNNDRPNKVCACLESKCAGKEYLGCVDRPTPEQSKYILIAKYVPYSDNTPSIIPVFVRTNSDGSIRYKDKDGKPAYKKPSDNNYYLIDNAGSFTITPAKSPIYYWKLPLPNYGVDIPVEPVKSSLNIDDTLKIREYYQVGAISSKDAYYIRDVSNPSQNYGISFKSIIAKTSNNKPEYNQVLTYPVTIAKYPGSCVAYYNISTTLDPSLAYYPTPAGKRLRDLCCPSYITDKTQCPIVPDCNSANPKSDINAQRAICPGVYNGLDTNETENNICLELTNNWNIFGLKDSICDRIPDPGCPEITEPSSASGYAVWPEMDSGTQTGSCDPAYGLTPKEVITITPKSQTVSAISTAAILQVQINGLASTYGQSNYNIPQYEIDRLIGNNSNLVSYSKQQLQPKRTCNISSSTFTDGCRFMDGCPDITKASAFSGYATWDGPSNTDISTRFSNALQIGILKYFLQISPEYFNFPFYITGSCTSPNITSIKGSPEMSCISVLDKDSLSPLSIARKYWDFSNLKNACIKN